LNLLALAKELGATGRCICPGFLTPALSLAVRADLDVAQAAGAFARAGTGQGLGHHVRDLVRSDEVYWPDTTALTSVQQSLWAQVNALKQAFNESLYLGLQSFEGHYAAYAQGGFYRRHRDSFQADDARMVSLILYLNPGWVAADGGRLRLHEKAGPTDVDPLAGTLVCFLSREMEHEVLASHATRYSFTGWFKTQNQRAG
jgi:SM-20-related protein